MMENICGWRVQNLFICRLLIKLRKKKIIIRIFVYKNSEVKKKSRK